MAAESLTGSKVRLNKFTKEKSSEDQAYNSLIFVAWEGFGGGASYLHDMILCLPYTFTSMRMLRYLSSNLT